MCKLADELSIAVTCPMYVFNLYVFYFVSLSF